MCVRTGWASLRSDSGLPAVHAQPVRGYRRVIDGAGLSYRIITLPAGGDGRPSGDPIRGAGATWPGTPRSLGLYCPLSTAAAGAEPAAARQTAPSPRCSADGPGPAVPEMRMSQTRSS